MTERQRKRVIAALLVGIPIGGYALFSSRGVVSRIGLEIERRELQERIVTLKQRQDSLKKTAKQLETDTLLIEKLARERYGMVKPGENVYVIEQKTERKK